MMNWLIRLAMDFLQMAVVTIIGWALLMAVVAIVL